jgi:hypothetical protein
MMKSGVIQIALAGLTMVLVVLNILFSLGNQSIQADVNERQQIIAQAIQMEQLNRQVVAVLANMAMKSNDEQLKSLLSQSGFGFGVPSQSPSPSK